MSKKEKLTLEKLKSNATVLAYNQKEQQYEPVVFQNGIKVDLDHPDFRRGLQLTPGALPPDTSNCLYNERLATGQSQLSFNGSAVGSGGGGGDSAPVDAKYLLQASNSTLTHDRVLAIGNGITLTDAGAGDSITVTNSAVNDQFVTLSTHSALAEERVLTAGGGIKLTDSGATKKITIDASYDNAIHVYTLFYFSNSAGKDYPSWYDQYERSTLNTDASASTNLIAPWDGELKKIVIMCARTSGTNYPRITSLGFHKNQSTTAVETQTVDISEWYALYTASFSSSTFQKGDVLHLSVNPGDTFYTLINAHIAYDQST